MHQLLCSVCFTTFLMMVIYLFQLQIVIEGVSDLVTNDRQFLSFDLVSMPHGQGGRKERGFFLFNDLLIITSIKRRSGTIKKPST